MKTTYLTPASVRAGPATGRGEVLADGHHLRTATMRLVDNPRRVVQGFKAEIRIRRNLSSP